VVAECAYGNRRDCTINARRRPWGRLDLLVDPSSNLSTKYTFLYPGLHLIPELACMPQRYRDPDRGHRWALLHSILLFLSELVDAGQRALCIAEIRNPVAAVQTRPRRLPTSVPTAPQCSSFIRNGSAKPVVHSGGNAKAQPSRRAKPPVVNGDPRSLTKTKGEAWLSGWSRRSAHLQPNAWIGTAMPSRDFTRPSQLIWWNDRKSRGLQ
jgi:hypothetical protein